MIAIAIVAFSLALLLALWLWLFRCDDPVAVTLKIRGDGMADINKPFAFVVEAFNAAGRQVPDSGITVALSGVAGTIVVDPNTGAGTMTATAEGNASIVATDGKGLVSQPLVEPVVDDNPATLVVRKV